MNKVEQGSQHLRKAGSAWFRQLIGAVLDAFSAIRRG